MAGFPMLGSSDEIRDLEIELIIMISHERIKPACFWSTGFLAADDNGLCQIVDRSHFG
jgi:hypothetical protein